MINKVVLVGRLTKDAEIKKTNNGTSVVDFTLAVNKDKEHADFINCRAWKQSADFLGKYGKKGQKWAVGGRCESDQYEKDGQRIFIQRVVAENVECMDTPKQEVSLDESLPF